MLKTAFTEKARKSLASTEILEELFELKHKFGWTDTVEGNICHFQVLNPQSYKAGCNAQVLGGRRNLDGSRDMDVRINY